RMREIGGKTSRFVFTSPSSAFLRGCFFSMRDTLSDSWRDAGTVCRVISADDVSAARGLAGATASVCAGPTSVFSFFFGTLVVGAFQGLWLEGPLPAPGLR